MRIAVIDKKRCRPEICGYLCQRACPRVRAGDETIEVGEDKFPIIHEDLCAGCGICVSKCPFGAIIITNTPEEAGILTHQYGKNGFRLYGLPVPKQGAVVGILGENGIGKSTALKILSGQLKPNLGREGKVEWEEIIERYRGSEIQNYLKSLASGRIRGVYKPQYVDALARIDDTVAGVLRRVSNEWRGLIQEMGLEKVIDRKMKALSGGELQRVAIAIAILRDVDLYFFDEPTSYLDIMQRIEIAKRIRRLGKEKAVIVVEHDLIVLDYVSDYIHITFGKRKAFGVFSKLKKDRVGINEYLDGWLRSENIRIREGRIRFERRAEAKFESDSLLCRFPEIKKRYPGFEVVVEGGEIYKGGVIGVVGPNATGKTTMMRILVGEEENDGERVDLGLKISYKPQYIRAVDKTVREILSGVTSELYKSAYKTNMLSPLGLEGLLDRNTRELSGGELQRVAIAECLSRDADIYFLDEPSAYLDVEERLVVSKIIRRKMENEKKAAIVIDHDIGFIDYVSDMIMVFSGEPSVMGRGSRPKQFKVGMNEFLQHIGMTLRRDEESGRLRVNKPESQKDKEQRAKGEYYR